MERLTDYTQKNGLGFFGQVFGNCGRERSDRTRACDELNAMPARIDATKKEINSLNNGLQMKQLNSLEQEIGKLRTEKIQQEALKKNAIATRDAWRDNPDNASVSLGYVGLGLRLTCSDYQKQANNCRERTKPLAHELGRLQGELNEKKKRISPENIRTQTTVLNNLKKEVSGLKNEISKINQETANIKNAYNARKEAERLALERERQEREAVAAAAAKKAAEDKKKKDLLLIAGAIAAAAGLYYLSGNKKGTQQKMKVKVKV